MVKQHASQNDRPTIRRPLGGTEKIYWLLDKIYSLNFAAYVELEGQLDEGSLLAALRETQETRPLLRCRITLDGRSPAFEPVASEDYPLLIETLPLRGWRRYLEQQLDTPFPPGSAPLARFLWFRGSAKKSVAAMVFHHPIADGRSGLEVLLSTLRRATRTTPALPYRPARASVQELDFIRQKHPLAGKLQEMKFWIAKAKELVRMASQLPGYDMDPTGARESHSISLTYSKRDSSALLNACRANSTSIHGALGAAQILALNDEFDTRKARVMALNSLADLRSVIDGDLSEQDLGLYVSTLTTVHALEAEPDFWGLATEIRDGLKKIITSGDADLIHSFYPTSILFTPDEKGAKKVQKVVALAPPSSMLTNIGRIDEVDLGASVAVKETGFLLSPPAQYPICVTASTYQGRMILNLLYDRAKINQRQARRIGDNVLRHLDYAVQSGTR